MDAYQLFQDYICLQHQIDEFYHELAVRQELSDSALLVLWTLLDLGDGCTQRDICRQFALTKQTVHSSVRKLAKDGFLTLRPGPGREVHVYPTEAGRHAGKSPPHPKCGGSRLPPYGPRGAFSNAPADAEVVPAVPGRGGLYPKTIKPPGHPRQP